MNSPFANLYIALQARLSAQVATIAHVAPDVGQLSAKTRPPVSWPCALIDFEDFTFTNLSRNVQVATGVVVIKLGFAPHSTASQDTPGEYRDAAIGYYDIEWDVHKALQGWGPTGEQYGSLCRTSVTTQRRTDAYRVRELRYSLSFDDYSTKPVLEWAPAELVVAAQIAT